MNDAPARPGPGEPRVTPLRLLGLALCALLQSAAGWAVGWGLVGVIASGNCGSGYDRSCTASNLVVGAAVPLGLIAAVLLLTGTAFVTAGNSPGPHSSLPIGAGILTGIVLSLLGAALGARSTSVWLLGPAVLCALGALCSARLEERGRRRSLAAQAEQAVRAERLREHGVTVRATVVDVDGTDMRLDDRLELVVTVRYTTADGEECTTALTGTFPLYDLPRRGDDIVVRYDPLEPRVPHPALRDAS
ncbi:DUF3592 domain-containing protein [Kitasatospora sp. NPDC057223]|uniref:DUF3592 domain-containing protein n=1 Tax=Kitasatospora sp. NPDC057223 TaxID=3346055 RepID=UPI00363902B9